ncbi:MAG: 3-hydroxyacyl-CoA dehydrogenase [Nocardioides sp.]|uniref:SDR family NAD(P)-dependent oxidoreductase n=1 Tax=Nocardioides TaxID=1839 RepID=UPI000C4AFAB1|nr:3-hydroxyacyl-CoA dehydrogenase [Nocardioides sp.]|tara:strand:- start:33 stop:773 length:741 start_codon:yes stop_codon:yes gene_type:complete
MDFVDRTFLVSGGTSGLGRATTLALLERGAKVVAADLRGEVPAGATFAPTDVTNSAQVQAAVDTAVELGGFAGAVSCAGIAAAAKVLSKGEPHSLDVFLKVLQVNLAGTFNVARLAAKALSEGEAGPDGERGVIVNTASGAAYDGQIGQAAYSASKAGVVGMTLPLARELATHGIRVMAIAPGLFLTPMLEVLPQAARESLGQQVPFPARLGDPMEFADLVCHIIENRMLNGEVVRIDGSIRMAPR